MASTALQQGEVREWILGGCVWKNTPLYTDPLQKICNGQKLLAYEFVLIDILDCIFARGAYKHLRPVGRYKLSHPGQSYSQNIYSQGKAESIPGHIIAKYARSPKGIELARNEWKIVQTCCDQPLLHSLSSPSHKATHSDDNMSIRMKALSFVQIWLSQAVIDASESTEKSALKVFPHIVKIFRRGDDSNVESVRNVLSHFQLGDSSDDVARVIYVLLISRDLMQDLRYNWGCKDYHRLRLPVLYSDAGDNVWENVFLPSIIACAPLQSFCRGSLAGIVALADILAYHVIQRTHHLAVKLCSELVVRMNSHSLGFEISLRATRAALRRWAFEQNRGLDSNPQFMNEPKEIVLPILMRLRHSLGFNTCASEIEHLEYGSRKRGRDGDVCRRSDKPSYKQARLLGNAIKSQQHQLFSQNALQEASQEAQKVTSAPGDVEVDKIGVLDDCIRIIEAVVHRTENQSKVFSAHANSEFHTMVCEILHDLKHLDLSGELKEGNIDIEAKSS